MARRDYEKGALSFAFVPIPREVLSMPEYQSLPSSAKALMLDLAAQYTGKNNGRLTPAFDVMQRCGWTSKTTLLRAKAALLSMPFAILTRKGHPPRTCEWLAFTWWRLDYEKSMDAEIDPKTFHSAHYLNFMPMRMGDPNTGRPVAQKQKVWSRNGTVGTGKVMLRGQETKPMEATQ